MEHGSAVAFLEARKSREVVANARRDQDETSGFAGPVAERDAEAIGSAADAGHGNAADLDIVLP